MGKSPKKDITKDKEYHKVLLSSRKKRKGITEDEKYHVVFLSSKPKRRKKKPHTHLEEKLDFGRLLKYNNQYFGKSQVQKKHDRLNDHHWRDKTNAPFSDNEKNALLRYSGHDHADLNSSLFQGGNTEWHDHDFDHHLSSAIQKRKFPMNTNVYTGLRSPEALRKHDETGHILLHNPAYTSASISPVETKKFAGQKKQDGGPTSHVYWKQNKGGDKVIYKENSDHEENEKYDPVKHKDWSHKGSSYDHLYHTEMGDSVGTWDRNAWSKANKGGEWVKYGHILKIHVPKGSRGVYLGDNSDFPEEREVILHKNSKVAINPEPVIDHNNNMVVWHGHLTHDGVLPTRHGERLGLEEGQQKRFNFGPRNNPIENPAKKKIEAIKKRLIEKKPKPINQGPSPSQNHLDSVTAAAKQAIEDKYS